MANNKIYTDEQFNKLKYYLVGNRSSAFGRVYNYMLITGKDPFGSDIEEFWDKSQKFVYELTKQNKNK